MMTSANYEHKDEEALRQIHPVLLVQRSIDIKNALENLIEKLKLIIVEQVEAQKARDEAERNFLVAKRAVASYQKMLKRNKNQKLSEDEKAAQQDKLAAKQEDEIMAKKALDDAIDTVESKNEWRVLMTDRGHNMVSEFPVIDQIVMEFKADVDAGRIAVEDAEEAIKAYQKNKASLPHETY